MDQVLIDRKTGCGTYGDVLDAAEWLARNRFASATLALCEMARQSQLYRSTGVKLPATSERDQDQDDR